MEIQEHTTSVTSDQFSTRVPARESVVWRTPMFEQYWRIRDQVDAQTLLFYRMGDFYELFGADAVVAAPVLGVQLTARNKDAEIPVPMCGVPAFAVDSYAEKLLAKKYKVALCEQLSDPATSKSKLVERGIIRILTPGLPIDYSRMNAKMPHYLVSLHIDRKGLAKANAAGIAHVCAYDFLGAELFAGALEKTDELWELFVRLDPKEILISHELLQDKNSLAAEWKVFDKASPWYSLITPWAGADARKNLEEYLLYTQRVTADHIDRFLPESKPLRLISGAASSDRARIPVSVLEQWAVFPQLFDLLNGTGSALGARALRDILSRPLRNTDRLKNRQDFIEFLGDAQSWLKRTREVYDLERLLGRFRIGVAAPKELVQLCVSLRAVLETLKSLDHQNSVVRTFYEFESLEAFSHLVTLIEPLACTLERLLVTDQDAAKLATSGNLADLIRPGFDENLDRLRSHFETGEEWLAQLEIRLRQETDIPSLKVRYNRVFGYFIEVTKTHLSKVPAHFERKQTTVGGERFTLAELRDKEHEILTAASRSEARAKELLETAQQQVLEMSGLLKELFRQFAWVDALAGVKERVSSLKRFGAWNFPEIDEGSFYVALQEARHPVIETLTKNFVSNSLELGVGAKRLLLLTGPNMAGKSTLMRQTGLCLLLAQCGFPVPAQRMKFAPCSGFFSRMGASDKILEGESTFMVEMKESAQILQESDENSFVLIDEIGRGTSTEDGLAIAQSVLEYLHNTTQARCIFATHYHELSEIALQLPHAQNASMAIEEWKNELVFLRKLKNEAAESSYGIYVAKMAGLPKSLVARAKTLFDRAEKSRVIQMHNSTTGADLYAQPDLFAAGSVAAPEEPHVVQEPDELQQKLSELDMDSLSPKQAWSALEELSALAKSKNLID